jgi:hypothetical protein
MSRWRLDVVGAPRSLTTLQFMKSTVELAVVHSSFGAFERSTPARSGSIDGQ